MLFRSSDSQRPQDCSPPGSPVHGILQAKVLEWSAIAFSNMEQQTGSKLGKEYVKAVYCQPAYLTYMQEYIMLNAGLEETQAGIKTAGRHVNNLRYADDTILMAESEEDLKSLLKVKEESEKLGLKLNIQKI